jgi:hypothetical protein
MSDEAEAERAKVIAWLDAFAAGAGKEQAEALGFAATCIHLRMHLTWAEYCEMLEATPDEGGEDG